MPWSAPTHKDQPKGKQHQARDRKADDNGFYSLARWRRLRVWWLARNPLCCDPFGIHDHQHNAAPASEVDHIVPRRTAPELALELTNLQSMCKSCHSRKTRQEGGL
jgi:5-methylcytosine-specific restriction protein A